MFNTCNSKYAIYPYVGISLLILFIWVYIRYFKKNLLSNLAFIAVLIGSFLNILEWWIAGCVKDYIKFFTISAYNINDLIIVVGLGILFIRHIYDE